MFKYSKYLFTNIFSKKGFWITLLVSLTVITVVGFLRIKDENERGASAIDEINNDSKFLPFLFASLITTLSVVYTFKDGQQDGSELLISSKPLRRERIILGKFFVLILMIILVQLLIFITIYSFSQFDSYSSSHAKFRYSASIAFGGIIIMLIVGSVSSFLAIYVSRIGLISLGVIASSMIPIVSMIITPISKGSPHELSTVRQTGIRLANANTLSKFESDMDDLYNVKWKNLFYNGDPINGWNGDMTWDSVHKRFRDDVDTSEYVKDDDVRVLPQKPLDKETEEKYFAERWYDKVAPFDVWYQWSGFYDILMGKDQVSAFNPIKWELEERVVDYDVRNSLDPNDDPSLDNSFSKVFLVINQNSLSWNTFSAYNMPIRINQVIHGGYIDTFTGQKVRDQFNDENVSLEQRLYSIMHIIDPKGSLELRYDELYLYKKVVEGLKAEAPAVNGVYPNYKKPKYLLQSYDGLSTGTNQPRTNSEELLKHRSFMFIKGDHVKMWIHHKYIQTQTKVLIWSSIAGLIFLLTIGVYLRKDFK